MQMWRLQPWNCHTLPPGLKSYDQPKQKQRHYLPARALVSAIRFFPYAVWCESWTVSRVSHRMLLNSWRYKFWESWSLRSSSIHPVDTLFLEWAEVCIFAASVGWDSATRDEADYRHWRGTESDPGGKPAIDREFRASLRGRRARQFHWADRTELNWRTGPTHAPKFLHEPQKGHRCQPKFLPYQASRLLSSQHDEYTEPTPLYSQLNFSI